MNIASLFRGYDRAPWKYSGAALLVSAVISMIAGDIWAAAILVGLYLFWRINAPLPRGVFVQVMVILAGIVNLAFLAVLGVLFANGLLTPASVLVVFPAVNMLLLQTMFVWVHNGDLEFPYMMINGIAALVGIWIIFVTWPLLSALLVVNQVVLLLLGWLFPYEPRAGHG